MPDGKERLVYGWLLILFILFIVSAGTNRADARKSHNKMRDSYRSRQPMVEKRNPNYQCVRLISVQKAGDIAVDFCHTPNNGAQAVYNGKFDVDVNKIRYFYFDMAYVLSRHKELRTKDVSILSLFVNSAKKEVYQAIEFMSNGELYYVPGKRLKR